MHSTHYLQLLPSLAEQGLRGGGDTPLIFEYPANTGEKKKLFFSASWLLQTCPATSAEK